MLHLALRNLLGREGVADRAGEDEGELPVPRLLVPPHVCNQALRVPGAAAEALEACGQIYSGQMTADTVRILRRAQAKLSRKLECQHHSDGDGLSVQPFVAIAAFRLQRVSDGV